MIDDVYEILLHFLDFYLRNTRSCGDRWRLSYILAVSWEALKEAQHAVFIVTQSFILQIILLNKYVKSFMIFLLFFKKRKILFAVFVISTQMAVIFILKTAGRMKI